MKTSDFIQFLDDVAASSTLASGAPPRALLPFLIEDTGADANPESRVAFPQFSQALAETNAKNVYDDLKEHIKHPSLQPVLGAYSLLRDEFWEEGWGENEWDQDARETLDRRAAEALTLLARDDQEHEQDKNRLSGHVVRLKERQSATRGDRTITRFSFGSVLLKIVDANAEDHFAAIPILSHSRERVSGDWLGLRLQADQLLPAGHKDADFIYNPRLRCRIYPRQIRRETHPLPAWSRHAAVQTKAALPGTEPPWRALASCNLLWGARQIFDWQQTDPNVRFWQFN